MLSAIKSNLKAYQLWETTGGCSCALYCATALRQQSLSHICDTAGMWISSVRPLWQLFNLFLDREGSYDIGLGTTSSL